MRRRDLLASSALPSLALAGCLADPFGGAETVGAGDALSLDGVEFELGALHLQTTFVDRPRPPGRPDAVANPRGQFAVLPLAPQTDDEAAAVDALADARVDTKFGGSTTSKTHYLNAGDQREIRLAAPVTDRPHASDAAVVFADAGPARYPLDDDQFAVLDAPPEFSVDAHVPDATDGRRVRVELVVWNRGDSPGTLAWTTTNSTVDDAWWTHRTTVPAGDDATVEHVHDRLDATGDDAVSVTVDYGLDRVEHTVTVQND